MAYERKWIPELGMYKIVGEADDTLGSLLGNGVTQVSFSAKTGQIYTGTTEQPKGQLVTQQLFTGQVIEQIPEVPAVAAGAAAPLALLPPAGGNGGTKLISTEVAPVVKDAEYYLTHPDELDYTKLGVPGVVSGAWPFIISGLAALGIGGVAGGIIDILAGNGGVSEVAGLLGGGGGGAVGQYTGGTSMSTGGYVTGQSASGTYTQGVTSGTVVAGVPFGGIGVPEPPASMVMKAWKTKAFSGTKGEYWVYFWRLIDGRVMCWNAAKNEAKIWKPKKNMVLSNNPRLPDLLKFSKKANRMLDRLDKQADKVRRQFGVTRTVYRDAKKR